MICRKFAKADDCEAPFCDCDLSKPLPAGWQVLSTAYWRHEEGCTCERCIEFRNAPSGRS